MTAVQDSTMDQIVIWLSWAVWGRGSVVGVWVWSGEGGWVRTCEDGVGVAFEGRVDVDVVEADGGGDDAAGVEWVKGVFFGGGVGERRAYKKPSQKMPMMRAFRLKLICSL